MLVIGPGAPRLNPQLGLSRAKRQPHVAGICTAELAAVQPGMTTNSVGGQFGSGLDGLANPAVAIGVV